MTVAALELPRFTVHCCAACPLRSPQLAPAVATDHDLTARELQIARAIAGDKHDQQIADELHISLPTVKYHIANARRKLRVHSRTAVAVWAVRNGLA